MKPPPEPFTNDVVRCPSCSHGIDPHGSDPGGPCGVGNEKAEPCQCFWSPNDIAADLARPGTTGPEVMKTFTVTRAPDSSAVHIEADSFTFPWHISQEPMTYERGDVLDKLTLTLLIERGGATFPEDWDGVIYEEEDEPGMPLATIAVRLRLNENGDEQVWVETAPNGISLVSLLGMLSLAKDTVIRDRMAENEGEDA